MDIDYEFPGTIRIALNHRDLMDLQSRGLTVERDGFSGIDSKTWVHLGALDPSVTSYPNRNSAEIEPGGDLHVRLQRGFLPRVTIDQSKIDAKDGLTQHYLGEDGSVIIDIIT